MGISQNRGTPNIPQNTMILSIRVPLFSETTQTYIGAGSLGKLKSSGLYFGV